MQLANYKTSTDYSELWDRAKTNRIVCIADNRTGFTSFDENLGACVVVQYGGFPAWTHNPKPDFIRQCRSCDLKWIVPEEAVEETCQTCSRTCIESVRRFLGYGKDCRYWWPKESEGK